MSSKGGKTKSSIFCSIQYLLPLGRCGMTEMLTAGLGSPGIYVLAGHGWAQTSRDRLWIHRRRVPGVWAGRPLQRRSDCTWYRRLGMTCRREGSCSRLVENTRKGTGWGKDKGMVRSSE